MNDELPEMVLVKTPNCIVCMKPSLIVVPLAGLEAVKSGEMVQDAFPDLASDQLELLISGTHDHCWETLMSPDE